MFDEHHRNNSNYSYQVADKFTVHFFQKWTLIINSILIKSRCITAVPGNTIDHLFVLATNSLKKTNNEVIFNSYLLSLIYINKIHLLQFLENKARLVNRGTYIVPGVTHKVFPHSQDQSIFYISATECM